MPYSCTHMATVDVRGLMTGVLKHLLSPWIINSASELRACDEPWDICKHETRQWLHPAGEGAVNWLNPSTSQALLYISLIQSLHWASTLTRPWIYSDTSIACVNHLTTTSALFAIHYITYTLHQVHGRSWPFCAFVEWIKVFCIVTTNISLNLS